MKSGTFHLALDLWITSEYAKWATRDFGGHAAGPAFHFFKKKTDFIVFNGQVQLCIFHLRPWPWYISLCKKALTKRAIFDSLS